ncbi:helix-turn-helix transcriptional regulator [Salipiger sp. H15]|uniref:Helix-turn-helix transcriptional regulator n=1 Tax=Alloyangia sp. H15 TaxID=3029062 RepID=A0AAU8AKS9_9RHOB
MSSTRFAKLLIDTADSLAEARTGQDVWDAAVQISRKIGAKDLNCGAIMRDTRELAWLRSSMDPRWLQQYHDARFYEVDTVLAGAKAGVPHQFVDVRCNLAKAQSRHSRDMYGCLVDYDYRYFVTQTWTMGETERTIVLGCADDPNDLYGPGTRRAFQAVSAMLTEAILPPADAESHDWICASPWSRLNPRERDMLSYLASGLLVHEIAERLFLTTDEVDRHLFSACRKLGVVAPEQALALAMARQVIAL